MNFKCLSELTKEHQYEEVRIIGRDAMLQGRLVHFIGMVKKGDEAVLFILSQASQQRNEMCTGGQEQPNRELFRTYAQQDFLSMRKLNTGGVVLESRGGQSGCLFEHDLDSMLLLAKFMEAGWQLPEGHAFWEEDWEQIEMMRWEFSCTSDRLPEWDPAGTVVTWGVQMKQYLIEKPVRLILEDAQTGRKCEEQTAFTILEEDGVRKEAICYINHVRLEDVWEQEDRRFADPEYEKRMLEHMTREEFASMKQSSLEAMEQACPRGKYFIVVEYECTLDLNLQFYMRDYLDTTLVCHKGSATVMLFGRQREQEKQGVHGLPLKSALIQEPVAADVKEVQAELFKAYVTVPEWEEEVEFL